MKSSSQKRIEPVAAQTRAYLASLAPDARRAVTSIRHIIRTTAPDAVAAFTYGIPGFRLDGRVLVWYAGWKAHCSLYPMTATIQRALAAELEGYETSKGTIRFPLAKPLPLRLITKLVKARVAEVRQPTGSAARRGPRSSHRRGQTPRAAAAASDVSGADTSKRRKRR